MPNRKQATNSTGSLRCATGIQAPHVRFDRRVVRGINLREEIPSIVDEGERILQLPASTRVVRYGLTDAPAHPIVAEAELFLGGIGHVARRIYSRPKHLAQCA